MIILIAKNTVKEEKTKEFLELAGKMVEATRKEKGCLSYDLAADRAEGAVYYFIEKYRDEQALEEHRETEHFKTYVPLLGELRTKPSELTKCDTVEF